MKPLCGIAANQCDTQSILAEKQTGSEHSSSAVLDQVLQVITRRCAGTSRRSPGRLLSFALYTSTKVITLNTGGKLPIASETRQAAAARSAASAAVPAPCDRNAASVQGAAGATFLSSAACSALRSASRSSGRKMPECLVSTDARPLQARSSSAPPEAVCQCDCDRGQWRASCLRQRNRSPAPAEWTSLPTGIACPTELGAPGCCQSSASLGRWDLLQGAPTAPARQGSHKPQGQLHLQAGDSLLLASSNST